MVALSDLEKELEMPSDDGSPVCIVLPSDRITKPEDDDPSNTIIMQP